MGADPIKDEQFSARAFLDYQSFAPDPFLTGRVGDFDGEWRDDYKPKCIVEHALMPVSGLDAESEDHEEKSAAIQFMSVGLLLFEPRFDPESERWYVDVELKDVSAFSEPFMRFGIVRYCQHGREDLRVSQPSVVWAKILPQREVFCGYSPADSKKEPARIEVKVQGPHASIKIKSELKDQGNPEKPQMHMLVMRESVGAAGSMTRQQVELDRKDNLKSDESRPTRKVEADREGHWIRLRDVKSGEHVGHWEAHASLKLESPLEEHESLVAYIEEVEQYRPATYRNEPMDPAILTGKGVETSVGLEQDYLVETGPRFSARVVLQEAHKKAKPVNLPGAKHMFHEKSL